MAASGKNAIYHYRSLTAGARPSVLGPGELFLNQADGVIGWPNAAGNPAFTPLDNYLVLSNDYTTASMTLSNIFQFSGVAGGVYEIDVRAAWQASLTSLSMIAALTCSSATTMQVMRLDVSPGKTGTTAPTFLSLGTSGASQSGPAPSAANTSALIAGRGLVMIGATAGTVSLQAAASVAGTLTIKAGSLLKYRRIA